jgi:hypothetical protein
MRFREPACVPACVWFFSTPCRVTWSIEGGDEFGYENVITTHFASAERRPRANNGMQRTRSQRPLILYVLCAPLMPGVRRQGSSERKSGIRVTSRGSHALARIGVSDYELKYFTKRI